MANTNKGQVTLLKFLREMAGLTQRDLAEIIGVTEMTVRRCEQGQGEMRLTCEQWQRFANWVQYRFNIDVRKTGPLKLSEPPESGLKIYPTPLDT